MSPRNIVFPLATAALLFASSAHACFVRAPQPVQVILDHVRIDVINGIATKSYECTFKNPNGGELVGGECYLELEAGAQIDQLAVTIDGDEHTAEILSVEEANKVFTEIVTKGGSPALLEYYGNQLIRTKLPRVPAGQTVTVKLRYTMLLKKSGDLYRISCLNTSPKTQSQSQSPRAAHVTVRLKSDDTVKTVYSPSHELEHFEEAGWDVGIKWTADDDTPVSPFVLYFQTAPGDLAASLIAHRMPGEDGTFLLILSPTQGVEAGELSQDDVLPKDVVFCVDTSGSMIADGKMEQARAALKHCVSNLRPQDRFNIVAFGTAVSSFRDEPRLVEASDENRQAALAFVDELSARGGTHLSKALATAFGHLHNHKSSSGRMPMLLLATDGLPTIGERDPATILAQAKKLNTRGVRLFAFGEGYDVNAALLDALAREHHGETDYILPTEKIDERIARFFDRVGSPVLTDLTVAIDGIETQDVFPAAIPDLFLGEPVMLLGRYRGFGAKTVRLTGRAGDQEKTYSYDVTFPEITTDDTAEFVPRLWAGRKIDALLTTLRGQATPDAELIEEVTSLATRFGIVTPYTSFLLSQAADETQPVPPGLPVPLGGGPFGAEPVPGFEAAPANARAVAGRLRLADAEPMQKHIRRAQVLGAKELGEARRNSFRNGNASDFYRQAGLALNGYAEQVTPGKRTTDALQAIRYIGNRTFFNRGGQWQESTFRPGDETPRRQIDVGSQEYLDLLDRNASLARYLALGNVVFEVDGEWVEVR